MFKKLVLVVSFLTLFFLITPTVFFLDSQQLNISQEKVEYNLPYPGILPDHPLFFLKKVRDKLLELVTRDSLKKADLYLLFSDKRAAMSLELAKKGKDKYAVEAFREAEQYSLKIPPLLEVSKEQGVSSSSDFILRLKLSNEKHREVENTLLKDLPQGQSENLNDALNLNQEVREKIENL